MIELSQDSQNPQNPAPNSQGQSQAQGQGNPDIRKQVEESRGFQKKLELLIPGLRNYRTLEDIRVADRMLRDQVANKLDQAKENLSNLRQQIAAAGDYTNLTSVGSLIAQIQQLGGQVRYAQQGYSGWVATITMNADRLNQLYEYDYNFVSAAFQLTDSTSPSALVYDPSASASIQTGLSKVRTAVNDFKQKWTVRVQAVQGVLMKE